MSGAKTDQPGGEALPAPAAGQAGADLVGLPFAAIARQTPSPCWICGPGGDLVWVNDAWSAYTGKSLEEIGANGVESIHDPRLLPEVNARWASIVERGVPDQMIFPIRGADGEYRPFLTRIAPLRNPDGDLVGWFGEQLDLTQVPMAEQLLEENRTLADQAGLAFARAREAETLRQRFWEASRDLFAVIPQSTGRPSLMNTEAWARTLGYTAEQLSTTRLSDLIHPDDKAASLALRESLAGGGSVYGFENRYRTASGGWVWLSWSIVREGDLNYCIARDVTHDKEDQARLAASERQLRLMIQSVVDYAIFMLTPDGRVANWNAGAARIKGYEASEIIGQPISIFYTEADRAAGLPQRALATAASEGRFAIEGWRVRKDGTPFWALVVIDAIRDESGALIGFAKITRDFSERRKAELDLRQAQEQLAHAQKMEAIGQLTGGVAHDFNNLLAVISSGLKLLRRAPERAETIYESMQDAVDRGARLTQQLLGFSRRQTVETEVVRPAERIRAMGELLRPTIGEHIQIDIVSPDTSWTAEVDPGQLELAVLNLAVNARDAMPDGGALTIAIDNLRDPERGELVRITASDTGPGMTAEVMRHAFEPFFTTKDFGQGSGMGLAQVYGFAKQAGGRAWIENRPGGGLSVHIDLPRSLRPAKGLKQARTSQAPAGARTAGPAGGRVLLVEDDAGVATMMQQVLSQAGFQCSHAASASDALSALETQGFDVVFSDIVMPGGMNGVELARRIRARWPRLPIVLSTGYSAKADVSPGEFTIFQKPFDADKLVSTLRAMAQQEPK